MMRFRSPERRERGATAVEAAIVTPVVIMMLLGIVEMGMLFKDYLGVSTMVRSGVRMASAHPRDAQYAALTAQAVQDAGAAVDFSDVQELWVYKLDRNQPTAETPVGFSSFANCTQCVRYRWNSGTKTFTEIYNGWPASAQNACPSSSGQGPPDRVGVYIKLRHPALTGLIFRAITVEDAAAISLEPMPSTGGCS